MSKIKKSPEEIQDREIVARIAYGKHASQITNLELSRTVLVSPPTYYEKLKNPGDFTLDQLRRISKKLHMPLMVLLGESPIPQPKIE